jgi:uncharacterized membrane protein
MLDGVGGEWLHLGLRWLHVVAGAAWIGTSFYFNFLNHSLRPPPGGSARVSGELWAVHGGGFYHVEKFAVAPETLPETLHWFKWEAYATWLSGFSLLAVVYYLGPFGLMVDPAVADISRGAATAIGLAVLVLGWLVYDGLCRTPLIDRTGAFAAVGFVLTVLVAFGLTRVLAARAAYIHVGAMLGTIMAANVFRVIIPSQREMVAAMEQQRAPDAELGRQAARRSLHNNYLTLPVLFVMVSNHFPTVYGDAWNWAILAAVSLGGAAIRHWFNLRGQGRRNVWVLPVATVLLLAAAFVTIPREPAVPTDGAAVSDDQAMAIVGRRCAACHSASPTMEGFSAPPRGIELDRVEQVLAELDRIERVAIATRVMPLGNRTGMTDEERATLGRWIDQRRAS